VKCAIHDDRDTAGTCSCSDIVRALHLSDADVDKLRALSKAINRTAYYGGLGLEESGKYLGLLDRILAAHGRSRSVEGAL
jgi:hypothetical protein